MPTFNDPLYSSQWHLNNLSASPIDLNILPVWEDYTGNGIRVGIQEGGAVQYSHPDLVANYSHSIDYDTVTGNGSINTAFFFQHATAVAGVIGASANNGIGGIGVAYNVDLASYQIANSLDGSGGFSLNWNSLAQTFNVAVANGIDILNNSWGSTSVYGVNFNAGFLAPVGAAIESAVANGRSGLGINIVWSAGNSRSGADWSNSTNFANSPYTIAVAAVGEDREYSYYSSPGANILVSAPSNGGGRGITTTDLTGSGGYSSNDYTSAFGGTSSAAPKVSGVIALMLEANPNLGYRDVQDILAYSARRAVLETPTGAESKWVFNGADDWNGGGLHHNNDYGFGLVDATAAVRLAETWQSQSTRGNESVATHTSSATSQLVNGSWTVSQTINISTNVELEYVQLAVNMAHAYSGDVILRLVSPSGTVSTLKEGDGTVEGASVDWPGNTFLLSSSAFWGENSAGTWRLEVNDSYPSLDDGVFFGFSLTVRGTSADNNDTYIFTDEFSVYGAGDISRRTITDTGGTDILNTAAVSGAQSINLNAGHISSFAGQSVVIAAGTIIEDAYTGDGADMLVGNAAANRLDGGRGNDTLLGGGGADTLWGGRGDDTYVVSTTGDLIVEDASEGNDLVQSSVTQTLSSNVERLHLTGTGHINGAGNSSNNNLTGNSGNNFLFGNSGNDQLIGAQGNDTIDGGTGVDFLSGGVGDDTYIVDNLSDSIVEASNQGTDSVQFHTNRHTLSDNVENAFAATVANTRLSGNSINNSLAGNAGNDTIDGGEGQDTLRGGDGDDVLISVKLFEIPLQNASFDDETLADGAGGTSVPGWTTTGAGVWNPSDAALATGPQDNNVMWVHNGGSTSTQTLAELFDSDFRYTFTFDHGTRSDYPGGEITAEIRAGGVVVGSQVSAMPGSGWQTRTIVVNGADFAAQNGSALSISFTRTGDPNGQAQLNNVVFVKEISAGVSSDATQGGSGVVTISNASFDDETLVDAAGQVGASGWTTTGAGIWNPTTAAIATNSLNDNVMWIHNGGATASQSVAETFSSGSRYTFTFDHGTRNDYPGGEVTAVITAGGVTVGTIISASPASGWVTRTIVVNGSDFAAQNGSNLSISFTRSGNPSGQAQLNNVALSKDVAATALADVSSASTVPISNASFDDEVLADAAGQVGASGWTTAGAGIWNPTTAAIATNSPNDNVMWIHNGGATASQSLSETFSSGSRYTFTFDHGTRNDYPGGEITAEIRAGSVIVGTVTSAAPTIGWESRTITINGADFAAYDGSSLSISFTRTGNPNGQAQIDNVTLVRNTIPGAVGSSSEAVSIVNASFDDEALADAAGQVGASGWTTTGAGIWNPTAGAIATNSPNDNVMWIHNGGATASQSLAETFSSGSRYTFTFDHGTRNDYPGGEITAEIRAGSVIVGTVTSAAPTNGWESRSITINGADFAAYDGNSLSVSFTRTGNPNGQAQIDNVSLSKESTPGAVGTVVDAISIVNPSFEDEALADTSGQVGAAGWITTSSGIWNPSDGAIATMAPDTNVMWLHNGGATASQALVEAFDSSYRYTFTFEHGTRNDYPGGEITAEIRAGSVVVGTATSVAPSEGWTTRTMVINGADFEAQNGDGLTISFTRTGDPNGQAQLNNINLTKMSTVSAVQTAPPDLADELYGEAGNDLLISSSGDDVLSGGSGNDTLDGGQGDDLLTGGLDNDTFFFENGDGLDTIADFSLIETDTIHLFGYGVGSFAALSTFISDAGDDALITFNSQNVITLQGISSGALVADDFLFF